MGLTAFNQASSCALFKNGELLSCIFEENLTHIKDDRRFPVAAIRETLFYFDLTMDEIDLVCFSDDPLKKIKSHLSDPQTVAKLKKDYLDLEKFIRNDLGYDKEVFFTERHKALLGFGILESQMNEGSFLTLVRNGDDLIMWKGSFSSHLIADRGMVTSFKTNPKTILKIIEESFMRDEGEILVVDEASILKEVVEKGNNSFVYVQGRGPLSVGVCVIRSIEHDHKILMRKSASDHTFTELTGLGDFKRFFQPVDTDLVIQKLQSGKVCAFFKGSIPYDVSSMSGLLSFEESWAFAASGLNEWSGSLPNLRSAEFRGAEGLRVTHQNEALDAFLRSDYELLILGNHILQRSDIPDELLNLYRRILKTKKRADEDHTEG